MDRHNGGNRLRSSQLENRRWEATEIVDVDHLRAKAAEHLGEGRFARPVVQLGVGVSRSAVAANHQIRIHPFEHLHAASAPAVQERPPVSRQLPSDKEVANLVTLTYLAIHDGLGIDEQTIDHPGAKAEADVKDAHGSSELHYRLAPWRRQRSAQ